ncbi:MAG: Crp/Fnr family transcriptional regulator [Caulobacteraceae bacterium]
MPHPDQKSLNNRLLTLMSTEAFGRISDQLTFVQLPQGMVIAEPDHAIPYVYFPERGMVSIVAVSRDGQEVEGGVFGRDGVGSTAAVLGVESTPNRLNVQIEGDGWRMDRTALASAAQQDADLRGILLLYVQTLIVQTTYTALANAVHQVDVRLARWLLMSDDRSDGADLMLTHHFLSVMLAVRRPSVTNALHTLEGRGFIRADRGCIRIRDRPALEHFAGDAYGQAESTYEKLIGPLRRRI